jgi:hypothetical protein
MTGLESMITPSSADKMWSESMSRGTASGETIAGFVELSPLKTTKGEVHAIMMMIIPNTSSLCLNLSAPLPTNAS